MIPFLLIGYSFIYTVGPHKASYMLQCGTWTRSCFFLLVPFVFYISPGDFWFRPFWCLKLRSNSNIVNARATCHQSI